ncbi:right-handed parallel beta-helix repeat-containing protein [Chitinispirillales bacterium ANBcel5]|uniref:right-handed parallel beta-helix repeat-containing protein n=1 Tax=Cellulosispirillum alkaliphilum TaxID=3039283 RepID=UPI002A5354D0|nr:right-handed parallel beta-helix repeat-containing protein [Chitinispirillales bacterium ANBcel5]
MYLSLLVIILYYTLSMAGNVIYVSPNGLDSATGEYSDPFSNIQDAINSLQNSPACDTIIVQEGSYLIGNQIFIDNVDGLTIKSENGANVRIMGGITIPSHQLGPINDDDIVLGVPGDFRDEIRKVSLSEIGVNATDFWNEKVLGQQILPRLVSGDTPLNLTRWPDSGYTTIENVRAIGDGSTYALETQGASNWVEEKDRIAFFGFWYHDWYANYFFPKNVVDDVIIVPSRKSPYGFREGQRFYALNILNEIKKPGDWVIDTGTNQLFLWPLDNQVPEYVLTANHENLLNITRSNDVIISDISISFSGRHGVHVHQCNNIKLISCEIRNTGGNGISVSNSSVVLILNNNVSYTGRNAISVNSGDVKEQNKSGNLVVGNTLSNWGRFRKTYSAAVRLAGSGNTVLFNTAFGAPHQGMEINGLNNIFKYNEVYDVCRESQDMGIIYTGRDWTARGNIISQNYLHSSGTGDINGVYLDDMVSGLVVENNLIENVPTAFKLGGGRDIFFRGNIISNCSRWIAADNRAMSETGPFRKHILPGGTAYERLVSKPYKAPPWTTNFPALQFILDDEPDTPKGNIITDNIIVGESRSRIASQIPEYGLVTRNDTVSTLTEAKELQRQRGGGFVGRENVGAKAFRPEMLPDILAMVENYDHRQPLLPILQEKHIYRDRASFVFARTNYLNKMDVTLRVASNGTEFPVIYRSAQHDTVVFRTAPGELVMRAKYKGIEGVLPGDYIERHFDTSLPEVVGSFHRSVYGSLVRYTIAAESFVPGGNRVQVTDLSDETTVFEYTTQSSEIDIYPLPDGEFAIAVTPLRSDGDDSINDTVTVSSVTVRAVPSSNWALVAFPSQNLSFSGDGTVRRLLKSGAQQSTENRSTSEVLKDLGLNGGITVPLGFKAVESPAVGNAYWYTAKEPVVYTIEESELFSGPYTFEFENSREWQYIGSPYTYPVRWSGKNELWRWNEHIQDFERAGDLMKPWTGYLYNPEGERKVELDGFPYIEKEQELPVLQKRVGSEETDWVVQIIAETEGYTDQQTFFGFSQNALNRRDYLDQPKPTRPDGGRQLFFNRPDWNTVTPAFSSDFRRTWLSDSTQTFTLSFSPHKGGSASTRIRFDGLDNTGDYRIILAERDNFTEIEDGTYITIADNSETFERTLIVTTSGSAFSEFPQRLAFKNSKARVVRPGALVKIPYQVPFTFNSDGSIDDSRTRVTMEIFDLRGRRVTDLVNRNMRPGSYTAYWDGKLSNGNPVGSGVYIIALRTRNSRASMRIVRP